MASARSIDQGFQDLIIGERHFDDFALELFLFQASENPIYKSYLNLIKVDPKAIKAIDDIPCLPISFYKQHRVTVEGVKSETTFTSSNTTGQIPSQHHIHDLQHYKANTIRIFENAVCPLEQVSIFGLLPNYLERSGSSLVCMVDHFIKESVKPFGGFYLHNYDSLIKDLEPLKELDQEAILFAVRYALLDLAEKHKLDLSHVTIIETGGMKGKRGPVSNEELRTIVNDNLKPKSLLSEYGMTELLSQSYSDDNFIFSMPDTMRVRIADLNDPFCLAPMGKSGRVQLIDLANLYSCAFIATDDLGQMVDERRFKILGRIENSEQRGCNLLVSDVIT